MKKSGLVGGITLAVVIIVGVILAVMCTTRVPAGYVAVQYNVNGGVKEEVLTQGWHFVPPTVKTTLLSFTMLYFNIYIQQLVALNL